MDKVHDTLLMDHLRDVYDFGASRIPYGVLKRWFGAERLTKKVWMGIQDRWNIVLEENDDLGWRLCFADNGRNDDLTLICLDPEGTDGSYIKPVEQLYKSEAVQ